MKITNHTKDEDFEPSQRVIPVSAIIKRFDRELVTVFCGGVPAISAEDALQKAFNVARQRCWQWEHPWEIAELIIGPQIPEDQRFVPKTRWLVSDRLCPNCHGELMVSPRTMKDVPNERYNCAKCGPVNVVGADPVFVHGEHDYHEPAAKNTDDSLSPMAELLAD